MGQSTLYFPWGSISEISPRGIAGHIGRELHGKLGDHTAVD